MTLETGALPGGLLSAGLTLDAYVALMQGQAARARDLAPQQRAELRLAHAEINLQRMLRILRTSVPSPAIRSVVGALTEPQYWMVLTEAWCGDSAQNVPYIAGIAALNPLITLRMVLRDQHAAVMDRYLTNGKRSIPKLVAFSVEGGELFQWGPRARGAQELVEQCIRDGIHKEERLTRLHLWYGRDRGESLETELAELIRQSID